MKENIDLTGDPEVEEQIRQYYLRKKYKENQNKIVFAEGVAIRERERVEFTIDSTITIPDEELELYSRNNAKAWKRHDKADATRRRQECQEMDDLLN